MLPRPVKRPAAEAVSSSGLCRVRATLRHERSVATLHQFNSAVLSLAKSTVESWS